MSILDMEFWSRIGIKKRPEARWKKYYSKKEMKKLVKEADEYLKAYKENNKGWL